MKYSSIAGAATAAVYSCVTEKIDARGFSTAQSLIGVTSTLARCHAVVSHYAFFYFTCALFLLKESKAI
jgi:hypothetical protein